MRHSISAFLILNACLPSYAFAQTHSTATSGASAAQFSTASVTVTWDPNVDEAQLSNYAIHWGLQPGVYTTTINAGKANILTLQGLPNDRDIYISATAVKGLASSAPSEEIVFRTPPYLANTPKPPSIQNMKIVDKDGVRRLTLSLVDGEAGKKYALEVSEDLTKWVETSRNVVIGEPGEVIEFPFDWPLSKAPPRMFFRFRYMR